MGSQIHHFPYSLCLKTDHILLNRKNPLDNLFLWRRRFSFSGHDCNSIPRWRTRTPFLPFLLLPLNLHSHSHSFPIRYPIDLPSPSVRPLLRPRTPSISSPMSSLTADSNPHPNSVTQCRVVIKGRVQGVFYRDWTVQNATELGLSGWVRNRRDGSVEALFSGPSDKVQEMQQRCRRGPPAAVVTGLEVVHSNGNPGSGFERRPTV